MALPVLQAMLLADQIYQDRSTGKYVICGIFSAIHFVPKEGSGATGSSGQPASGDGPSANGGSSGSGSSGDASTTDPAPGHSTNLPFARLLRAGSPHAYISLTELRGQRRLELRFVDLKENTVLFSVGFDVTSRDPLETVQITIPLPTLPIAHAGVFVLELLCDGELLGSHRVIAKPQQA